MKSSSRSAARTNRHQRLRQRVVGSAERPRLAVYRSLKHIYAQVIDDEKRVTLLAASTLEQKMPSGGKRASAKEVGLRIAGRAKKLNIKMVVFDRGGFLYHGRVKAVADAAREGGLKF